MEIDKDNSDVTEENATIIGTTRIRRFGSDNLGIVYIVLSLLFQSASVIFGKTRTN